MDKSKFRELHDYCQTLTPKISRNQIIGKIKELTDTDKLRVVKTSLDISVIRGFFLSASNVEHEFVKKNGFHVIVLARDLNECWARFVNVKEAMHLLDDSNDLTDTDEKFERLLSDFSEPPVEMSPQTVSDYLSVWMTLACFCPEKIRQEYEAARSKDQMDDYEIALKLKIPAQYIPMLFRPNFPAIVKLLRGEDGAA